jgi:hypothetical protein
MPSDTLSLITVFISYSYDSQEHMAWVGRLADALEKEIDIHVVCDQYDVYAGSDVTEFMKRGVESDRVVMVLTPTYAAKAQAPRTGVRYENLLITGEIFKGAPSDKFIPALRGDADHSIPPDLTC